MYQYNDISQLCEKIFDNKIKELIGFIQSIEYAEKELAFLDINDEKSRAREKIFQLVTAILTFRLCDINDVTSKTKGIIRFSDNNGKVKITVVIESESTVIQEVVRGVNQQFESFF